MGGNGILGGGWTKGGKSRDRVEKSGVGKRRLEEKDVRWVMGGKVGVVKGLDGEQEFLTGLVEGAKGWSNGSYEIVKGGEEVDMIGGEKVLSLFDEAEELAIEGLLEECGEGKEVVRLSDRKGKGVERSVGEVGRMFEKGLKVERVEEVKRFKLVGEEVLEEEGDEEGVDSMEAWKLKKVNKERREKEERKKREKEGMVMRGKELGRNREEVKKLRSEFRDWREEVEEVCYILGEKEEKVRSFALDMEVRRWGRELRELVSKIGLKGMKVDEEVRVLSEVVVPEMVGRVEELKKKVVVGEGRSYGEVLRGVSPSMGNEEVEELEKKKVEERKELESSLREREKRLSKKVEVVLDTQDGLSMEVDGESEWSSGRMEEVLGLNKGDVLGMVKRKGRITVELKGEEEVKKVEEIKEEEWEEVKGVRSVGSLDSWAGMVIPAIEVNRWKGKMGELKRELEKEAGLKLMKDPVWLLSENRIEEWRMREVGVLVHVARESERVKYVEEGLLWRGVKVKVNRYVGKKEVEWCTKCAEFGHSWWRCGSKTKKCSICAVKGHTGWEHRCGRCQVWRSKCVHHGSCGGCGKEHIMKEANEKNCVAWRMEWNRLKSLY